MQMCVCAKDNTTFQVQDHIFYILSVALFKHVVAHLRFFFNDIKIDGSDD